MPVFLAEAIPDSLSFAPLFFKTVVVTILIVVVALLATRYLIPKLNAVRRNKSSSVQVLDAQALEPGKTVYVLRIEDRKVAVAATENSVTPILDLGKYSESK